MSRSGSVGVVQGLIHVVLLAALAMAITGCAGAKATVSQAAPRDAPRPDRLLVHDFTFSGSDVSLDRGLSAKAARDLQGRTQTEEEQRVGAAVTQALSKHLVAELNKRGITASHVSTGLEPTARTGEIVGQFVTVDEGDRTQRVWLGFGLGGSKLDMRVQFYQNDRVVSRGMVATNSSLKPGMLVSIGSGAATGGVGTAVALGAGGAAFSESFLATVEADAKRAAQAIADRVEQAYQDRGWL